jgi:hypothetical protein
MRLSHEAVARLCAGIALLLVAMNVEAQATREIGRTAAGNPVFVETRSLRREPTAVHAIVRVRFAKAVRAPGGDWWSSRTKLTLNCTNRTVAIEENWYYGEPTWTRVASHREVGQPGYGTLIGGSMTTVAYDALCTPR